ncbi:MAG: hypothetical protein Q3997_09170 [Propionibacteriaceae bacterium]|nr:hypothetical protein [Propionibacteriaceae bacterium]
MPGNPTITPAVRRTRALLVGGLAGGHLGAVVAVALALGLGGRESLVSALIGAAVVIVFFSIGQAIEIVAVTMASMLGLVATLFSYVARVILLGAGLRAVVDLGGDRIDPAWLFCGVVCCVLAWVSGVVIVAARQRVPVFDHDYQPPPGWDMGQ